MDSRDTRPLEPAVRTLRRPLIELRIAAGFPGVNTDRTSGFSDVTTCRGFELAIVDTNAPVLEAGGSDDFGVIVKAGQVRSGSPVVLGEFLFLSFMGGRQGEDIDSLAVGPGHAVATVSLLDLDPLDVFSLNAAPPGAHVNKPI